MDRIQGVRSWWIPLQLGLALGCLLAAAGTAGADSYWDTGPKPEPKPPPGPIVIMISFDGTSQQQVEDAELETFNELIEAGVWAELTPVFPTNTFPNHTSLVTGVSPDRHGIVNNVFVDPERGRHSYSADPGWQLAEPIWSRVERQGVVSASYHWVGSEGIWPTGRGPTHWQRFDARIPARAKVEKIFEWLRHEDPAKQPRLITCWFHGADSKGHRYGPNSAQVRDTLRRQDRDLGKLVDELKRRGFWERTTLIVVSDHGMARVRKVVDLSGALKKAGIAGRVLGGGGFATVKLERPGEDLERALEVARGVGLEAYKNGAAPKELRLDHPRYGDVVVLAPLGQAIGRLGFWDRVAQLLFRRSAMAGSHGYRPELPEMQGIFLAAGRGVPAGQQLEPVHVLDVTPTILSLLGLPIPGSLEGRVIPELAAGGATP